MIWYIVVSTILVFCFELIGRYILYLLKIDNIKCSFGIGLIVFLSYSYIATSLITALNCSFYIVGILYSLFFLMCTILIIKNRNKMNFKIDLVNLICLIGFVIIMLFFAYNTTLGNLNGFDSTYYINLVTSNIKANPMNYFYYSNSIAPTYVSKHYTFQTFYYIASYISYIFGSIINIFHKTYYQTTYIWVFQILFNCFFCSLIMNAIYSMNNNKNYFSVLILLLFFVFTYGRIYYYNVFGFYGNTYRIITVGYSTYILYLLTKSSKHDGLMMLFVISLLASASVSSSALFIDIVIMYGSYFILSNKYNNILKYYAIALFFIFVNLFTAVFSYNVAVCVLIAFIISIFLYIFSIPINSILSKKKFMFFIIIVSTFIMFISSLITTGNLFDFNAFFVNISEVSDMTINYFNIGLSQKLFYLKIFILLLIFLSFIAVKKEPFIMFVMILFVCIFNPFCCSFIFKIFKVFYRAFDIVVNPFTIVLYVNIILSFLKDRYVAQAAFFVCIIFVFCQNNPIKPLYYGASFEPEHSTGGVNFVNYNHEFKMSQEEKEAIDIIFEDYKYNHISNPYIITPCFFTQGIIPCGRYLYGRTYWNMQYKINPEKQLFAIFYPERYLGDHVQNIIPDYNNIDKYLKEAAVDYLVVDKTKEFFNTNCNEYSYLYLKVLEDYYSFYENERYIVFRCFNQ